jgi:Integrase zinc binding domain
VLCGLLGPPLQLDAAQFGSRAHRLRCYWTNLAPVRSMRQAFAQVQRPAGRLVQSILGPGRRCREVLKDDSPPFYVCNRAGQPMQAWPTLMATPGSYAFRGKGRGMVWDEGVGQWVEPTAEEREAALGYEQGATAMPGVSPLVRHQALGRCIDANVAMALVAVGVALAERVVGLEHGHREGLAVAAAQLVEVRECGSEAVGGCASVLQMQAVLAVALQQEEPAGGSSKVLTKDIWEDAIALRVLQGSEHASDVTRQERNRVAHRLRLYSWQAGVLYRLMPDGSRKIVPPPAEREAVVRKLHERMGHFGVRRTAHLVLASHWWRTLHADVEQVVR